VSAVRVAILCVLFGAIAASCVVPGAAESPNPTPRASALPAPPSSAAAVGAGTSEPIVAAVQDLLPSVVTVINKLPNGQPQSSGSGFIVDASRGYIVTNNHVVENVRDTIAARAPRSTSSSLTTASSTRSLSGEIR